MTKNFKLSILFLVFLIAAVSANCGSSKRDVLGKRNPPKKCNCQLAFSQFSGPYTGYFVYAQDECGDTTTTGFFSKGLTQTNYTFDIVDDCGNVIESLGDLDIEYTGDGGSKPFRKKFNFDLNCTKDGVLNVKSAYYKKKRNCHYYKRQTTPGSGNKYTQINGDPTTDAPIYTD